MNESKIVYVGDTPKRPGVGSVLIKVAPKIEKVNGFYIDTSWESVVSDGVKEWQRECDYILNDIRKTNDKARRNKMTDRELLIYAAKHYPSKPIAKQALGTDRYNTIHGTVLAIPSRLERDKITKKIPKCEVQVGDEVYFHYLALSNSSDWHTTAMAEDWATITYSSIFFAKRTRSFAEGDSCDMDREKIVMINNFVLLEEIESEPLSKVIATEKRVSTQKGRVAYVPEGSELKVGQIAYWMKMQNLKVEYDFIRTMPKPYIRVKEEMIVATEL